MVDRVALGVVESAAPGGVAALDGDRRRPGRLAEASPELIALMRDPASVSARVRVALYDAPGFILQPQGGRQGRGAGFLLRAAMVVTGVVAWCAGLIEMMCWAWG